MGSECSVYKDYELEEPIECSNAEWILYPAHSKGNNHIQRVTVFVHKKTKQERKQDSNRVTNSSQFLKILRHPGILKYYGSYDNSEVVMVTEPVEPLENVLQTLDVDEVVAGLHNIIQALAFLHDKGGLSHNNVSLSSIFVSNNDGSWKLGGMQCVCKAEQFNHQFIEDIKHLRDLKSFAPEEQDVTLTADTIHCIDAYGFGILVSDILDGRGDIGDSAFAELIQSSFLHSKPKFRPKLITLLEDDFFRNDYLDVVSFLSNITIKSDIDKDKFFSSLASKLRNISSTVVATRLLPKLMSRFVMAEPSAEKEFLPHLLTPDTAVIQNESVFPILPLDLFKKYCIPILFKLWVVKDLHIRIILLKYFPLFAKAFDLEDLEQVLLPQMLLGLHDTNDNLVSCTFNALANLVAILGGEVVVGGERQKYFKEGRPKFSLGSSSQDHRKLSFSAATPRKSVNKNMNPLNVSEALHMERNPESLPRSETEHKKTREREERVREEIIEEIDVKTAEKTTRKTQRTLLEIAKEHSADTAKSDDRNDELDDFLPNMVSNTPCIVSEGKYSPSRFTSTTKFSNKYDMCDMDFTQRSCDLITWDNITVSQSKPSTGKAMKLGSKKPATIKPNRDDLGQMFQVPDIHIKEADFFADMQPNVEFKSYDGGIGGSNVKSVYSTTMDVVTTTAQVGDDWDVDDWTNFD